MVPHFVAEGRYLSHGDDPYNSVAKADYPADLLLIDEPTFQSWFPSDDYATASKNVGRRVYDLAVWHFGDALLGYYCSDKLDGLDHASGKVFGAFEPYGYTLASLETTNLWERLETEAQAKGTC
jgi:hypothetical protein